MTERKKKGPPVAAGEPSNQTPREVTMVQQSVPQSGQFSIDELRVDEPASVLSDDLFSPENLAKLRVDQDFSEGSAVDEAVVVVPVRRPSKQDFVRVRPGEGDRLTTEVFEDEATSETYIVLPAMRAHLAGQTKLVTLVVAVGLTSKRPFVWPLTVERDGRVNSWNESARRGSLQAETKWTRLVSDRAMGAYRVQTARDINDEVDWAKIPPLNELLRIAFGGRIIDTPEHPIVKRLEGRI